MIKYSLMRLLTIVAKKVITPKFIRYALVGVISLGADYLTFLSSLYLAKLPLGLAVIAGMIIGLIVNFTLNKFWTFKSSPAANHHNILLQITLYLMLFGANTIFSYWLIHLLNSHNVLPIYGKIASTVIIIIWNYYIYKVAIFKETLEAPVIE